MKPKDIIEVEMPNGVKVKTVVIDVIDEVSERICSSLYQYVKYLCYSQNRLFYYIKGIEITRIINEEGIQAGWGECDSPWDAPEQYRNEIIKPINNIKIIVDYCTIPEYDALI